MAALSFSEGGENKENAAFLKFIRNYELVGYIRGVKPTPLIVCAFLLSTAFSVSEEGGSILDYLDSEKQSESAIELPYQSQEAWPKELFFKKSGDGKTVYQSDLSEEGKHVYRSKNFQITVFSDHPLIDWQSEEMATLLEGTYALMKESPLGVQAEKVDGYFHADFYQSEAAYRLASGRKMGSGVYLRTKRKLMLPVKPKQVLPTPPEYRKKLGAKFMTISYNKRTLVHEVTHMMMHDLIGALPMWAIEGTAEYVEQMPRDEVAFMPGRAMLGISYVAKKFRSRVDVDETLSIPDLLHLSSKDWASFIGDSDARQSHIYFQAFLLSAFFIQEKPEEFYAYLQECRRSVQEEPAKRVPLTTLLADTDSAALEKELSTWLRKQGLQLTSLYSTGEKRKYAPRATISSSGLADGADR